MLAEPTTSARNLTVNRTRRLMFYRSRTTDDFLGVHEHKQLVGPARRDSDGRLWAKTTAAALCCNAAFTTSHGYTMVWEKVRLKSLLAGGPAVPRVQEQREEDLVLQPGACGIALADCTIALPHPPSGF